MCGLISSLLVPFAAEKMPIAVHEVQAYGNRHLRTSCSEVHLDVGDDWFAADKTMVTQSNGHDGPSLPRVLDELRASTAIRWSEYREIPFSSYSALSSPQVKT